MRKIAVTLAIAVVAVAAGVASWRYYGRSTDRPQNVLLITVDTLRPDHLAYSGYRRPTSPTIDRLAGEGVVFPVGYSVAGWTLPSIATILTGRYPRDHGATDFHWSVDLSIPTLASILRSHGYDTRGFVSHIILTPQYGVAEGFHSYDASVLNVGHPHDVSTGRQLTDLVIRETQDLEEPYFLWVHYFDPHFRFLPHSQWSAFGSRDEDRYDQEIAFTDSQIGRLLSDLEKRGLDDHTVVVFTSDHGEEFGEHGGKYHYTLYDEVMRTPLIIKAPSIVPGVSETVAQQIDIVPTVLSLLGLDRDPALPGKDLLADNVADRPVFMERDRPPPYNQRGVILGNYKLTVIELADTASIPRTSQGTYAPVVNVIPGIYLYDLDKDPMETNNIFDENDPKARELLVLLAEHFADRSVAAHEVKVDETLRDKLRSLGYVR